jgi:TRAP-type C4-dicarboxylate transport system permease small subunit
MHAIVSLISRISRILARAGGMLILLCAVLVSLDVAFRNSFRITIFESYELTSYAVAIAITFGFAWALVSKAHIRIEVIYNALPLKPRCYLDALAVGVLGVVAVILTYWGAEVAIDSFEMQSHSNSTLAIPMAFPQGLWALGLVWFAICSVVLFGVAVYGLWRRRYSDVQAIFGLASVEEEIDLSLEGEQKPGHHAGPTLEKPLAGTSSHGSH